MDGLKPRPGGPDHEDEEGRLEPITPDTEPGMNVISADFDIVMVNRANERLYAKPMVELLGKKCYREFEKRDAPCAHCPGIPAQATGQSHEAETIGIRDDGSRFAARVRAHPVQGPGDQPAGFIEVVEDITERKRAERIAQVDASLRSSLAAATTTWNALQRTLDATLMLEGVDSGCVFLVDPLTSGPTLVAQRGLSPEFVHVLDDAQVLLEASVPSADLVARFAEVPGVPKAAVCVPILHRERPVGVLVLGSSEYPDVPASMVAALSHLATLVGNALARIRAEQTRGDAVADLEAFVAAAPLAVWSLDTDGRVRMWNRAAERLFGWRASEVLNRRPPFIPPDLEKEYARLDKAEKSPARPNGLPLQARTKTGELVAIRAFGAPFRDLVGDASRVIIMAVETSEPAGITKSKDGQVQSTPLGDPNAEPARGFSGLLTELAKRVSQDSHGDEGVLALADSIVTERGGRLVVGFADQDSVVLKIILPRQTAGAGEPSAFTAPAAAGARLRVLIIDHDSKSCAELSLILSGLDHSTVVCGSGEEAVSRFRQASEAGQPFDLVIVELVTPEGPSALETTARIKGIDPTVKVIVSSDSPVLGYEHHGFAAMFRKPYAAATVGEELGKLRGCPTTGALAP